MTWYADSPRVIDGSINFHGRSEFTDTQNDVDLWNSTEYSYTFVLRWAGKWHDENDKPINLDLHLYDPNDKRVAGSHVIHDKDDPEPIECILGYQPSISGPHYLVIESVDGSSPEWVQLVSHDVNLQFASGYVLSNNGSSYSLGNEAESASDGMLAVGAVDEYGTIASYSSQGPTIDGRIKPDLTGRTGVSTSHGEFSGTSAAAPHVAGMVALYYDYFDNSKPDNAVNYMKKYATNSGNPNNIYGYGFARLPDITTPNTGPSPPTTGVFTFLDATIHQGRPSQYGMFIHDKDATDTLTMAATSSNPNILKVSPAPNSNSTMRQSTIGNYWVDVIHLDPQSAGTSTVTATISDGLHKLTETFTVTVSSNHHPKMDDIRPPYLVYPNSKLVTINARDADNDPLTYTGILPPGKNIVTLYMNANNLTITPTSAIQNIPGGVKDQVVVIEVSDGNGGFDYRGHIACVAASNSVPSFPRIVNQTMEGGGRVAVPVSASDTDGDRIVFATPYSRNYKVAAASIESSRPLYLTQTEIGSNILTSFSLENMTAKEGVLLSATLSGRDSHGNILRYVLNGTNIIPHIPQSVSLSSNTRCPDRSADPTTIHNTLHLSGMSAGNSTVTLTALDPWGSRVAQNVTVAVLPALPPVVSAILNQTIHPGNTTTITVNATDNYQTVLQYRAVSSNATVAAVSPATFANLTSGNITITAKAAGIAIINVTVSDGIMASFKTFTVTVPAPGPSFEGNTTYNYVLTCGVAASFTLPGAVGGAGNLTYAINGTLPSGLSFDNMTRVISGTPTTVQNALSYTYVATDTAHNTDTISFTITIRHPQVSFTETIPAQSYVKGVAASFTLPGAVGGAGNLTYAINGTLPSGLSFDNTTRTIRGTPTTVQNALSYTYVATDTAHNTDTISFTITIRHPQVSFTETIPAQSYVKGVAASFTLPGAVGGAGNLTYAINGTLPSGLSFDNTTRTIRGTPTTVQNALSYTYVATDTAHNTDTISFTITIRDAFVDTPAITRIIPGTHQLTIYWSWSGSFCHITGTHAGYEILYRKVGESWRDSCYVTKDNPNNSINGAFYMAKDFGNGAISESFTINTTAKDAQGNVGAKLDPVKYEVHAIVYSGICESWSSYSTTKSGTPLADASPTFGTHTVSDQSYTKDTQIPSLTLPQATGGTGNLTYSITPTLPAGLSFDNVTRIISGTPTTTQSDTTYTYTATDTLSKSTTITFSITIRDAFLAAPAITSITPGTNQLTINWSWSGSSCYITGLHAGYEILYRKVGESWRDSYYVTKDNPNNSINGAYSISKDYGNNQVSESFTIDKSARDSQGNEGANLDPAEYEVIMIVYSGTCSTWSHYSDAKRGTPSG